jgi:transcriptional regulator with XRE-family HTH domain
MRDCRLNLLAPSLDEQGGPNLNALRAARAKARLDIVELADRSGVGRDTISRLERGKSEPHAATLHKLADALGTTVADLYALEERLSPKGQPSPPSVDWALSAQEEEFEAWLETANLDQVLVLNKELHEAIEDTEGAERAYILERITEVVGRFATLAGPFKLVRTRRKRPPTTSEDHEGREAIA